MMENTYRQTTHNIEVEVVPIFVPDQTQFNDKHLYTYNVSITNHSSSTCQLLRRHWIIMDGNGNKEEVQGDGVIGEQPSLAPSENFQYSSFCPLSTPTGNMRGAFTFVDAENNEFEVKVPLFFLRQDAILQ